MCFADDIKRKVADRQQQAQNQSQAHHGATEALIAILDELEPEVVIALRDIRPPRDRVTLGPTGLEIEGWVVSLAGLTPPIVIAFYDNQIRTWEFVRPIERGSGRFQAEPRFAALSGFASVLLGKTEDELKESISGGYREPLRPRQLLRQAVSREWLTEFRSADSSARKC